MTFICFLLCSSLFPKCLMFRIIFIYYTETLRRRSQTFSVVMGSDIFSCFASAMSFCVLSSWDFVAVSSQWYSEMLFIWRLFNVRDDFRLFLGHLVFQKCKLPRYDATLVICTDLKYDTAVARYRMISPIQVFSWLVVQNVYENFICKYK